MLVAPFGSASPGSRLVDPRYERGSREIRASLRSWSTSMSSFCQNVDSGPFDSSRFVGGSPGSRRSSLSIASSSRGGAGSRSEDDCCPKRPVTSITSLPCLYCRKLIAVAYFASGRLSCSLTFFDTAPAGVAYTSSAPTTPSAVLRPLDISPSRGSQGYVWARRLLGGHRVTPRRHRAQRAEDRPRRGGSVERVEVDSRRALGQQIGALERRVGDAEVGDRVRLIGAQAELGHQPVGDRGADRAREALDLLEVGDRHDPRDDRDVDPDVARPGDEVPVQRVVEEQLRDQEARAGVDLLLAVAQVALRRLRVDVDLGEAGGADREVVVGTDQLDQL